MQQYGLRSRELKTLFDTAEEVFERTEFWHYWYRLEGVINTPTDQFPKRRPHVFAAVLLLDLDREFNARCEIQVSGVTQTGMKIGLSPWRDTNCHYVDYSWLAFDEDFYKNHLKSKL
ncbi:hypothetical protein CDV36_009354 [Fusarium kuroshium]|uniref:H-type lectin domain-containing protein n=1 Tax=Fusarium kuroshium TaxID=2010991 RepID=A0A3M2S0M1_9HYPO|nr:hypothetical protein CDV36_009354 [Fusarium kuroshium]